MSFSFNKFRIFFYYGHFRPFDQLWPLFIYFILIYSYFANFKKKVEKIAGLKRMTFDAPATRLVRSIMIIIYDSFILRFFYYSFFWTI